MHSKIKVLWLCNRVFSETSDRDTGTWLTEMGKALIKSNRVDLFNISQGKGLRGCIRKDCRDVTQWLVPYEPLSSVGLPSKATIKSIQAIVEQVKPDVIHVWGTENYWGLLTARKLISGNVVLDMQGIKYAYSKFYYGGLSFTEQLRCIGLKELIFPSKSLFGKKRHFSNWGKFEMEMLRHHQNISTQSNWVRAHVKSVNATCRIFNTGIILRKDFEQASPWKANEPRSIEKTIFTSSSGSASYKGLHIAFRALAILKQTFPNIRLNIAGSQITKGLRRSGYSVWLRDEANRLNITSNINWLGPLDGQGIVSEYLKADVVLIPSFIETYCLALAESMLVGIPAVVSYAGAMPELADNEDSALFFPPGDEVICATQIERILLNLGLAEKISKNARLKGFERNDSDAVLAQQLNIYDSIVKKDKLDS